MISDTLVTIEQLSRQFCIVALHTTVKGLGILIFVFITFSCLKKASAQVRHLIWFLSLAAFIMLPVLSIFFQPIRIGILSMPKQPGGIYQTFASAAYVDLYTMENSEFVSSLQHQTGYTTGSVIAHLRWTLVPVLWFMGFLIASFRSSRGKIQARKIIAGSKPICKNTIIPILNGIPECKTVIHSIRFYSNNQVKNPFTIGAFEPKIVLPEDMLTWPAADIKPVLLHEIQHVKRRDYITQAAARLICNIFWFVPVMWIALRELYAEQETACDDQVLRRGVNPVHYAKQMIRIAGSFLPAAATPGLPMVNRRRKDFEKRVFNILRNRGKKMKKRSIIFIGCIYALILLAIAGCATRGSAISDEDFFKAWTGTWVNEELPGTPRMPQKVIANPDGTYDLYHNASDTQNQYKIKIELLEHWRDGDGTIWYRATMGFVPASGRSDWYDFGKISDSGNTFEHMYHGSDKPIEKWEPGNDWYNYAKYYRK